MMFNPAEMVNRVVPHVAFLRAERLLDQQMEKLRIADPDSDYPLLGSEALESRLRQEHDRSQEMDDKTTKLTASPSAALALLGFAVPVALREIDSVEVDIAIAVLGVLLAAFLLDMLYLVLGAVRTVERYGYGTADLLEIRQLSEAEAVKLRATNLRLQEIANLRRHNRNAASFSTLRNAFLVAVALLATVLIALLVEAVC